MPVVKIDVDLTAFSVAADRLGRFPNVLRNLVAGEVKRGGETIRDRAKQNASWSKKIPPSIRVSNFTDTSATVSAGNASVPIAALYETKAWRHPLFGNRKKWYAQPNAPRPYLSPAADQALPSITDRMQHAATTAADETWN